MFESFSGKTAVETSFASHPSDKDNKISLFASSHSSSAVYSYIISGDIGCVSVSVH